MTMKKFLIIIGCYDSPWWRSCDASCTSKINNLYFNPAPISIRTSYKIVVSTATGEVNQQDLVNLAKYFRIYFETDEIIIISHAMGQSRRPGISKQTLESLKGNICFVTYHSVQADEINISVVAKIDDCFKQNNWNNTPSWKQLRELIKNQKRDSIPRLSIIKHKIVHLFCAVDMDLQGLWEESQRTGLGFFNNEQWCQIVQIYNKIDWEKEFTEAVKLLENEASQNNISISFEKLNSIQKKALVELRYLKEGKSKSAYDQIKKNSGKSIINKWLRELDDTLASFIADSRPQN
jgi:hypothetical protein